ncbi:MAG: BlaI/MecI/CopY family transcriptional regulator [Duncaniella sp.]|uniref:BlaI/MecI/CopY family transcriptional regulator n=1 Tax=Duncaniella sp. TaxID=2518496 RepID=UPI0023C84091|nr:BlaI/MecI/CopY family transcriptional regulator [Duncaniella sp.]MDE5988830.1 BlaI/MecI/CopY family transcriptional regulator [Duncaniella sp.]
MKPGRKPQILTEKETVIMRMLWERGPMFVREMLEIYPEPKPHFNTISTIVRILEEKGHVSHEVFGGSHRYYAVARQEDFRKKSLARLVSDYFNNSYKNAVSALVEEEKISVEELREIIDLVERKNSDR